MVATHTPHFMRASICRPTLCLQTLTSPEARRNDRWMRVNKPLLCARKASICQLGSQPAEETTTKRHPTEGAGQQANDSTSYRANHSAFAGSHVLGLFDFYLATKILREDGGIL